LLNHLRTGAGDLFLLKLQNPNSFLWLPYCFFCVAQPAVLKLFCSTMVCNALHFFSEDLSDLVTTEGSGAYKLRTSTNTSSAYCSS